MTEAPKVENLRERQERRVLPIHWETAHRAGSSRWLHYQNAWAEAEADLRAALDANDVLRWLLAEQYWTWGAPFGAER